ncbi:hypothetical protein M885DRAFT_278515 [Pelagophyceae sp. CCMP2097]|nr:hypothetical protein M885DRAFT_278515 [Pelagophyceae sp. CCMP2097]
MLLRLALLVCSAASFAPAPPLKKRAAALFSEPMNPATRARIDGMVKGSNVMLFMKGTKVFPQCGFSNMAIQILNAIGADSIKPSPLEFRTLQLCEDACLLVIDPLDMAIGQDFETFDILSDESVRSGIKEFSDWPTIPQLYIAGEFVGGSDIMHKPASTAPREAGARCFSLFGRRESTPAPEDRSRHKT